MRPVPGRLQLPVILALALALRLWGIAFGLPYPYHPDEPAYVLQALAVARGLPSALTFANPPLYKYLLLGEYVAAYAAGRLLDVYASPQDFVDQFRADPTILYLIGRVTSALLGALSVFAAYALAGTLRGRRAALLAAWLTAVVYLLVRESHFAVDDALVALCVTTAVWAAVRIVQAGNRRDYLFAGAAVGLAFTAKYTGAVSVLALVLAHALRSDRHRTDLLAGLGSAAIAVLISFPSVLLETDRVVHDVYLHLYIPGQAGYDGLDPAGGYIYYLKILVWGLGWPISVLAGAGIILAATRRDRSLLVVAAVPIAAYAVLGHERMYFARFILPAIPALIVLAAIVVDTWAETLTTRLKRPLAAGLAVCSLAILLGAPSLLDSIRFDTILTREDTRTLARTWIESRLPAGTRLAVDWFPIGPPLRADSHILLVANGWSLFDLTLDDYRRQDIEYLIVASYNYNLQLLDSTRNAQRYAFYAGLSRDAKLIAEFRPYVGNSEPDFVYDQIYAPFDHLERVERPGPTLKVYALQTSNEKP